MDALWLMSIMNVLKSLSSISFIRSLHVGLISRSMIATAIVRLVILLIYPTCVSVGARFKVVVIIFVRRSLAVLMLLRNLSLRLPRLDMLGLTEVWVLTYP